MRRRKRRDVVETRLQLLAWDEARREPAYWPSGDRREGGVRPVRLLCGTWEPVASMPRETSKGQTPEEQSTDARRRGGRFSSSVKPGNAGGAKGPDTPADEALANQRWEEPMSEAKPYDIPNSSSGKPISGSRRTTALRAWMGSPWRRSRRT